VTIYNSRDVPLLSLGTDSREALAENKLAAVAAWEAATGDAEPIEELRTGARVWVENRAPKGSPDKPDVTSFVIGGADLDEAVKDVIGAFDRFHVEGGDELNPPRWVASTDPEIAQLLAEHWSHDPADPLSVSPAGHGCSVVDVSEVVVARPPDLQATRVAIGRDIESAASFAFTTSFAGTATTAPTATTFTTDGVNIPVNSIVGQAIVTTSGATRIGIVQSNTSAANSVLTIDRWYNVTSLPANRGVAAASTPTAGAWLVMPGNVAALYIGLTANNGAAGDGDTTLTGEVTTSGGGLIRTLATYAHTAAATTTTLTNTWTANGTDALPLVAAKIGVFQGVEAASRLFFETLLTPTTATLSASGDQLQVTDTVTL
jgi:hypothetical protein